MITSKFGLGQPVRHKLLGALGIVIDVDPEYSLDEPAPDEIAVNETLQHAPWYHVVMEDETGDQVHTYLAEAQLEGDGEDIHPEHPSLDELSKSIKEQLQAVRLRN